MKKKPFDPTMTEMPFYPAEEETPETAPDTPMCCTSETDMTGLIPTEPDCSGEEENYREIYPYLPPYIDNDQM
jgi:hypothetical protein